VRAGVMKQEHIKVRQLPAATLGRDQLPDRFQRTLVTFAQTRTILDLRPSCSANTTPTGQTFILEKEKAMNDLACRLLAGCNL